MSTPPDPQAVPDKLARARALANSLGRQLEEAGRIGEAMAIYRRALDLDFTYLPAANNLARLLVAQDRPREAVSLLERIAAGAPFDRALAVNYGNALLGVGRAREAEQRLRSVVAGADPLPQAYNSLGVAHYVRRDYESAAEWFARAIRAAPEFAEAHENRAQVLLALGRTAEGWAEYEWRWRNPSNALTKRIFAEPLWDGRPLGGRALLVHGEQGFGDTLQFARYLALVPKSGGRIVFACPTTLVPLMRGLAGIDEALALGDTLPAFDCQAPLLSLPRLLAREAIPDPSPYLFAEPEPDIARAGGFKIGLAWAGRARHAADPHRNRACDVVRFTRFARADARLYSLQLGEPPPAPIIDLGARIEGFAPTARVVAALDLVICVDTAVAHLAGALGKPTWVLLPYAPDWRWGSGSAATTPWYRAVRLFRQPAPGDWENTLARVDTALAAEIRGLTNI